MMFDLSKANESIARINELCAEIRDKHVTVSAASAPPLERSPTGPGCEQLNNRPGPVHFQVVEGGKANE